MGVAVDLLDAIVDKLNETTFGTANVERQIMPSTQKTDLSDPLIIVALQGKEIAEVDRSNSWVEYQVGVALHYPAHAISDYELGLNMAEDIQDWLSETDNRMMTITDGCCCLVPPFTLEGVFDVQALNEAGVMFVVSNFRYRFFKQH